MDSLLHMTKNQKLQARKEKKHQVYGSEAAVWDLSWKAREAARHVCESGCLPTDRDAAE